MKRSSESRRSLRRKVSNGVKTRKEATSFLVKFPHKNPYYRVVKELLDDLRSGRTSPPRIKSPNNMSSIAQDLASKYKPYFHGRKVFQLWRTSEYQAGVDELERALCEQGLDTILPSTLGDLQHPRCIREVSVDSKGDLVVGPKENMPVLETMTPRSGGRRPLYDKKTVRLILKLRRKKPPVKVKEICRRFMLLPDPPQVPPEWGTRYPGVNTWLDVTNNPKALNAMRSSVSKLLKKHKIHPPTLDRFTGKSA